MPRRWLFTRLRQRCYAALPAFDTIAAMMLPRATDFRCHYRQRLRYA